MCIRDSAYATWARPLILRDRTCDYFFVSTRGNRMGTDAIRKMFKDALRQAGCLLYTSPASILQGPKQPKSLPHVIRASDMVKLLTVYGKRDAAGREREQSSVDARNLALLEFLYACGARAVSYTHLCAPRQAVLPAQEGGQGREDQGEGVPLGLLYASDLQEPPSSFRTAGVPFLQGRARPRSAFLVSWSVEEEHVEGDSWNRPSPISSNACTKPTSASSRCSSARSWPTRARACATPWSGLGLSLIHI